MNKLLVITGQTATGKTKLALKYAHSYKGELINADSRQVYKYLDIITGKDKKDIGNIPIHLYDLIDPKEYFSSYDFKVRAEKIIKDILKRGKTPIIVGGTYLYLSHLIYGIETENIKPDLKLRKELGNKTVKELQQLLSKEELKKLNQSDKNNPRRLIRRIEAQRSSGGKFLRLDRGAAERALSRSQKFDTGLLAIRFQSKEQLTAAIRQRVEKRLKQGAIEELQILLNKGYKLSDPGLQATGCTEIFAYINGGLTKQQLVDKWALSEIHYAKRQYTFMKRDKNILWIINH